MGFPKTQSRPRSGKSKPKAINLTNMTEPEKLNLASASITDEQKAKLKTLFPEVLTEGGKIDFDRLKATLGEAVDPGKERYGLNWPGKGDCFKTIQRPSIATLIPARDESVNFDTTENLSTRPTTRATSSSTRTTFPKPLIPICATPGRWTRKAASLPPTQSLTDASTASG